MKDIDAIVFDLYGTLIHLNEDTRPYLRLLKEMNLNKSQFSVASAMCLTENFNNCEDVVKLYKCNHRIDTLKYDHEINMEVRSAEIYPETKKVLKILKDVGYKIGVISNVATPYKKPFFNFGLDRLVDHYVFSCDCGFKKPASLIYQLMEEKLGLYADQILMVGDSLNSDYNGARKSNINALLIDRGNNKDAEYKIDSLEGLFDILAK